IPFSIDGLETAIVLGAGCRLRTGRDSDVGQMIPRTLFERNLSKALVNIGISVHYQDGAGRVIWSWNVPQIWADNLVHGAVDEDFLPALEAKRVGEARRSVMDSGEPQMVRIAVPAGNGARWFDLWIDADAGSDSG